MVSHYGHDFRWCPCNTIFVDGGKHYLRVGGEPANYEIVQLDDSGAEAPR